MAILKMTDIKDEQKLYYLVSRARRSSINSFFLDLLTSKRTPTGKETAWFKTSNSKFDDYKRACGMDSLTYCKQYEEDKKYEKLLRDFLTTVKKYKEDKKQTNNYVDTLTDILTEFYTGKSLEAVSDCINFGTSKNEKGERLFDEELVEKIAKRLDFSKIIKTLTEDKNGTLNLKKPENVNDEEFGKQLDILTNDLETLPNIIYDDREFNK